MARLSPPRTAASRAGAPRWTTDRSGLSSSNTPSTRPPGKPARGADIRMSACDRRRPHRRSAATAACPTRSNRRRRNAAAAPSRAAADATSSLRRNPAVCCSALDRLVRVLAPGKMGEEHLRVRQVRRHFDRRDRDPAHARILDFVAQAAPPAHAGSGPPHAARAANASSSRPALSTSKASARLPRSRRLRAGRSSRRR